MTKTQKKAQVIGIGGVSRSGKTTLARFIKDTYKDKKVLIISQDDYVFSDNEIPKINNKTDWESPRSINFRAIVNKIKASQEDYDIIIVEGILAFYNKLLNRLYDKHIFMHISRREFIDRKKNDKRWGPVAKWYIEHIWDSYIRYGKRNLPEVNILFLDGTKKYDKSSIVDFLEKNEMAGELFFDLLFL